MPFGPGATGRGTDYAPGTSGRYITLSGQAPPPVVPATKLVLAEALQASGRRREAIDAFLAVVPYFQDRGDRMSEGNVYRTVGVIWQELGELEHAIDSLQTARKTLESTEPSPLLQHTLHALGHAHYLAGTWSARSRWRRMP